MTPRQGTIIVHKADPYSETDASLSSSDDAEVAEIAEIADIRYSRKQGASRNYLKRAEHRQKRLIMAAAANEKRNLSDSRRSSSSSLSSQDFPILRLLAPDRSPPVNRSHYSTSPTDKNGFLERRQSTEERQKEKPGFKALTSGSNTPAHGSPIPSRLHRRSNSVESFTSAMVPIGLCEFIGEDRGEGTIGGLQKLLKNLNIAEKLRQQKAEQERLNIHNLPPHMKKQLKHIYVY